MQVVFTISYTFIQITTGFYQSAESELQFFDHDNRNVHSERKGILLFEKINILYTRTRHIMFNFAIDIFLKNAYFLFLKYHFSATTHVLYSYFQKKIHIYILNSHHIAIKYCKFIVVNL